MSHNLEAIPITSDNRSHVSDEQESFETETNHYVNFGGLHGTLNSPASMDFGWWINMARSALSLLKLRRANGLESNGITDDNALCEVKGAAVVIRRLSYFHSKTEGQQLRIAVNYLESIEGFWNETEQEYRSDLFDELNRCVEQLEDATDDRDVYRAMLEFGQSIDAKTENYYGQLCGLLDEWSHNERLLAAKKLLQRKELESIEVGIENLGSLLRWMFRRPFPGQEASGDRKDLSIARGLAMILIGCR